MSLAWEETHRRYDLTHAVLAEVARTGRAEVPAHLTAEIDDVFGDFPTFLCDLRRRWYLIFDSRLDAVLENRPPNLAQAIADLRRDLEREHPALHALIDAYPEPTAVDAHHRAALLTATGVDEAEPRTPTRCVWTRRVS